MNKTCAQERSWRRLRATLERAMARHHLSMEALSKAAGLNDTAVRDILAGRSKSPRRSTLEQFARFLGVEVDDLYREPDEHPPGGASRVIRIPYIELDTASGRVRSSLSRAALELPEQLVIAHVTRTTAQLRAFDACQSGVLSPRETAVIDQDVSEVVRPGVYLLHDGSELDLYRVSPVIGSGGAVLSLESPRWSGEVDASRLRVIGRAILAVRVL